MSEPSRSLRRREFTKRTLLAGSALALGAPAVSGFRGAARVRVGVIGCGSVSGVYLPNLRACPFVELVSVCDIRPERARRRAAEHGVPYSYSHIDAMIGGAEFDLLVDLTDMQQHEAINRRALEAGRHVWSEKPIANSLEAGEDLLRLAKSRGRRLWAAPITVHSPQFLAMARRIRDGALGKVAAAHADYGHEGPGWSAFFYEKGGGSLPDLAVYNLTTLTGLLGPAKRVMAMLSIVTPRRSIDEVGEIEVEAEDNAMLLLDHGGGTISHVQSGFNYFNPHGHEGRAETRHSITVVGTGGFLGLVGYDWEPLGVDFATHGARDLVRIETDAGGYLWQQGASLAAECLATGKELLVTPEHALHVVEILAAARESQATGRRVELRSTFRWPLVS